MTSFMGTEQQVVYHGDSSLHDGSDVSMSWLAALPSSVLPFLNLAFKKFSVRSENDAIHGVL